jgi:drug/metabolite transporter (DMT)-like permease
MFDATPRVWPVFARLSVGGRLPQVFDRAPLVRVSGPRFAQALPTEIRALARRNPIALVWLGVLLYALGPVMVAASTVSGPVLSFYRLWIGATAFGLLTLVHVRVTGRRPDVHGWSWALRAGIVFGIHQLLFMSAIKLTSVVDVTLMSTLSPLVVGVLAVPMFGERTGLAFRLWSMLAIAGAVGVVLAGSSGPQGDPVGMLLASLNVVAFALFFLFSKGGREHIDVLPFLFGVMLVAAVTVSIFVTVFGEPVGSIDGRSLALAAGIALFPGLLGHFVMTWPLKYVPANIPPVIRLAVPLLAGGFAWLLLGQTIGLPEVVAGLITVVGVAGSVLSPSGRRLARAAAAEIED